MKEQQPGRMVVVEGVSAVGKTTQIKMIVREGSWQMYREPGGTRFGSAIREVVQGIQNMDLEIDPYAAFFAYSASRAQLVRGIVIPRLREGANILLDRYWFSSYAYQGSEGVDKKVIVAVSMIATDGVEPDLVIYLDLDPRMAIARKLHKTDLDRYDLKAVDFMDRVRANYWELIRKDEARWRVVDASRSIEEVGLQVAEYFREFGFPVK